MSEVFGRYRVVGPLARGGMGRLHIALLGGHGGFGRVVALKTILPHLASDREFLRMFLEEARLAAQLSHPNIVATEELGEAAGVYFIAMEYLPGEDLMAVLRRSTSGASIPVDVACTIGQGCAQGLQYAHSATDAEGRPMGVVHRDVSPFNVVVTYQGSVKLLDFGVAKAHAAEAATRAGVFKGKIGYAAPETLVGHRADARSDVFSLGVVLWEALAGRRLFAADSPAARVEAVLSRPIPSARRIRPEVSPRLDAVVTRALEREPRRRFSSAGELGEALAAACPPVHASRVAAWLEVLFGGERAALKQALAGASTFEAARATLERLEGREGMGQRPPDVSQDLPSEILAAAPMEPAMELSSMPTREHGSAALALGAPRWRRALLVASLVALPLALGAAVGVSLSGGGAPAARREASQGRAELEVVTQPAGAHVFIDGEPTGSRTPVVLEGLTAGRSVDVRVDLPGYLVATWSVDLVAGRRERLEAELSVSR